MVLTSPKSQDEYENLKKIWKTFKESKSDAAAIAGYLSIKTKSWVDSAENYNISWAKGEPKTTKGNEHCMFLNLKKEVAAIARPCSSYEKQFICEFNKNQQNQILVDEKERERFFQQLSNEEINNQNEVDIFVNREYLKASLIDAKLLCKTFGMEFFAKDVDDKNFRNTSPLDKFVCFKLKNVPITENALV